MSVLVLVEHDGKSVRDPTLPTVTAAAKLGDVHALVAGSSVGAVAEQAAKIGVAPHPGDDWETLFFRIFLDRIEPNLGIGLPTILYDYPLALAAFPRALERIENAVGIFELIRRDDALRAGAAAAAGVKRIAFDLADRQLIFVDVGEDAAG